jgi:lysyl-tRNA synthetase class 2
MIVAAHIAKARHQLVRRLRAALDSRGFVEVMTPVLHAVGPSPQAALFSWAGQPCDLRPCMELRLRSALAELDAVYEIGPCFRPDPPDQDHHPEFHMLELFWKKPEFGELRELTRVLLEEALGTSIQEFRYVDVADALAEARPELDLACGTDAILDTLRHCYPLECGGFSRAYEALNWLIDKAIVGPDLGTLERPAMLVNYPLATVCLAKPQAHAPHLIERMEVFIKGLEVCHGFVDDCDPERVECRMVENGPTFHDKPFLGLLRSGRIPASSGVGFGLERLLMLATATDHIRDCLHEPQFPEARRVR